MPRCYVVKINLDCLTSLRVISVVGLMFSIECEPIASCKLAVLDQLHPVDTHYADQSHSVDLYSAKTGCDWSICEITTTNLQSSSFGGLQKKPEINQDIERCNQY